MNLMYCKNHVQSSSASDWICVQLMQFWQNSSWKTHFWPFRVAICLCIYARATLYRSSKKWHSQREYPRWPQQEKPQQHSAVCFDSFSVFGVGTRAFHLSCYIIVFLRTLQLLCQITRAIKNNNCSARGTKMIILQWPFSSPGTILLQIGAPGTLRKYAYLM
jgi:hypothetical protein